MTKHSTAWGHPSPPPTAPVETGNKPIVHITAREDSGVSVAAHRVGEQKEGSRERRQQDGSRLQEGDGQRGPVGARRPQEGV